MLNVPLQVRLRTATGQPFIVTGDLIDDISFSSTVPGGFASCDLAVSRSLSSLPPELEPFTIVDVIDTRSADVVWSGRLDVPGRDAGAAGEVFRLTAVGAQASATDRTLPVIYNDARHTVWEQVAAAPSDAKFGMGDESQTGTPVAHQVWHFPRGMALVTDSRAVGRYLPLPETGQRLARLDLAFRGGRTESRLVMEAVGLTGNVVGASATAVRHSLSITTDEQFLVVSGLTSNHYGVEVRLAWTGAAATVGDDITWVLGKRMRVQGERKLADGSTRSSYPTASVPSAEIVADVVGRFLTGVDGASASIAASSFGVKQLAYEDGATAQQILEDVMALEPAYFWAAWEINAAGKARFEWSAYPTVVSLDVGSVDGFSSPGSAGDLYNEVAVRWLDPRGSARQTLRTAVSPPLTAADVVRRARLDLGSQIGDEEQAARAGDNFLEQHRLPTNNGQLKVSRPVADLVTGRVLQPWEIRPGGLVRVRNVAPRQDALNAGGSDAVTVFRVAQTDYSSSDNTATLTLDSFSWALERQIAGLAKAAARQLRK